MVKFGREWPRVNFTTIHQITRENHQSIHALTLAPSATHVKVNAITVNIEQWVHLHGYQKIGKVTSHKVISISTLIKLS